MARDNDPKIAADFRQGRREYQAKPEALQIERGLWRDIQAAPKVYGSEHSAPDSKERTYLCGGNVRTAVFETRWYARSGQCQAALDVALDRSTFVRSWRTSATLRRMNSTSQSLLPHSQYASNRWRFIRYARAAHGRPGARRPAIADQLAPGAELLSPKGTFQSWANSLTCWAARWPRTI